MTDPLAAAYDAQARGFGKARSKTYDGLRATVLDEFIEALNGPRVGDVGAGPGYDALVMQSRGLEVTALDFSTGMLEECRRHGIQKTILADVRDLSALDDRYDGAWAAYSLLHLAKSEFPAVLEQLARILTPDGLLGIIVFRGHGEGPREEDLARFGIARHFAYYEGDELAAMLSLHFEVRSTHVIDVPPRPSIAVLARRLNDNPQFI